MAEKQMLQECQGTYQLMPPQLSVTRPNGNQQVVEMQCAMHGPYIQELCLSTRALHHPIQWQMLLGHCST